MLLLLAAQLSLPVPLGLRWPDVRAVFSADDMPAYVQIAAINRHVLTRTTVRPDATSKDCVVERSGGDAKLDALTCAIILQRARFQPARWIDGAPVYGVIRVNVSWIIGSASRREREVAEPRDMELFVDRLPAGAGSRALLSLMVAVDETGRVVGCSGVPPIPRSPMKSFPQLELVACQRMTQEFTAMPAKDESGRPVRSVQSAYVLVSRQPR